MKRALVKVVVQVGVLAAVVTALPGSAGAAPSGNPGSYTLNRADDENSGRSGVVVRWNPCRRISVRLNPGPYGAAGAGELRRALQLAAQGSGLQLVEVGSTRWFPTRPGAPGQRAATGADLVVGYADPARTTYFGGGFGQGGYRTRQGQDTALQIVDGTAFVAADARMSPGFRPDGHSRGMLLLHEVGHALGLGHTADAAQVMAQRPRGTTPEYQRGDLTGLSKVGRPAGCIVTRPAPSPAASPAPSPAATSTPATGTATARS